MPHKWTDLNVKDRFDVPEPLGMECIVTALEGDLLSFWVNNGAWSGDVNIHTGKGTCHVPRMLFPKYATAEEVAEGRQENYGTEVTIVKKYDQAAVDATLAALKASQDKSDALMDALSALGYEGDEIDNQIPF